MFIPAHKSFRVIAIAAPVPPYPGYPLDPPFRSRFQARFIDPVGSLLSLTTSKPKSSTLYDLLRDIILSTQYASETRSALEVISKTSLPPFPQTALAKLRKLIDQFPPPENLSPAQLAPAVLSYTSGIDLRSLSGMGQSSAGKQRKVVSDNWAAPSMVSINEEIGIFDTASRQADGLMIRLSS